MISRCITSQRICLWFQNSLFQAKTKEQSACWHWHSCFGGLRGPTSPGPGGPRLQQEVDAATSLLASQASSLAGPFLLFHSLLWPLPFRVIFVCYFQPRCTLLSDFSLLPHLCVCPPFLIPPSLPARSLVFASRYDSWICCSSDLHR